MTALARRASLLVAWLVGACATSQPAATVEAWRYRELIVEGVEEALRDGGRWHDVLFLPDARVVALVVWPQGQDLMADPMMHARCEVPEDLPEDAVRIEIPRELAERIIDLALKTVERNVLARQLARDAVAVRAVGGQDSMRAADDEPVRPGRR